VAVSCGPCGMYWAFSTRVSMVEDGKFILLLDRIGWMDWNGWGRESEDRGYGTLGISCSVGCDSMGMERVTYLRWVLGCTLRMKNQSRRD
jgi:hypothetical protein